MIALKIIASGSSYFAVNVRMGQSSMSTELPLKSGARLVFSGSGSHEPASGVGPPSLLALFPPLHPVGKSRLTPSAAASIDSGDLEGVRTELDYHVGEADPLTETGSVTMRISRTKRAIFSE